MWRKRAVPHAIAVLNDILSVCNERRALIVVDSLVVRARRQLTKARLDRGTAQPIALNPAARLGGECVDCPAVVQFLAVVLD